MLHDWKIGLQWSDLAFTLPAGSRLVLRHNAHLQYGYTPKAQEETLEQALRHMEDYCRRHPKGNAKITGVIKVAEHTRLNGCPLWVKLRARGCARG
jgi:RecB family exonuclease